jgi:hypothetical protein
MKLEFFQIEDQQSVNVLIFPIGAILSHKKHNLEKLQFYNDVFYNLPNILNKMTIHLNSLFSPIMCLSRHEIIQHFIFIAMVYSAFSFVYIRSHHVYFLIQKNVHLINIYTFHAT